MEKSTMTMYADSLTELAPEFYVIEIVKANGEKKLRLHIKDESGNLSNPIEFYPDELKKATRILERMGVEPFKANKIINELRKLNKYNSLTVPENLGWQRDEHGNIIGYACGAVLDSQGNEMLKDPYCGLPERAGYFTDIQNTLSNYLSKNVYRQIIFLHCLSGLVCGVLGRTSLLALIASSSKGKSIISKLVQSIYCAPNYDKLFKTWNDTEMSLAKSLDGLDGVSMLIDDTQLFRGKTFQHSIYELTNGRSRARMVKGNQLGPVSQWAVSILTSAEKSMLDTCNKEDEGTLPRCLELYIQSQHLFDNAEEANKMETWAKKHYGLIAPQFASGLLKRGIVRQISYQHNREVKRIRASILENDTVLMRCAETIGIITLTAKLAESILDMQFDIPNIEKTLIEQNRDNIEVYRSEQESCIVMEKVYPALLNSVMQEFPQNDKGDFWVIPTKFYDEIIKGFDLKKSQVKQALIKSGAVKLPFSNVFYVKGDSVRGHALIKGIKTEAEKEVDTWVA